VALYEFLNLFSPMYWRSSLYICVERSHRHYSKSTVQFVQNRASALNDPIGIILNQLYRYSLCKTEHRFINFTTVATYEFHAPRYH
jgi:hypothetical protein